MPKVCHVYSITLPCNVLQACIAAGFAKSNGEARRAIQGGGIRSMIRLSLMKSWS